MPREKWRKRPVPIQRPVPWWAKRPWPEAEVDVRRLVRDAFKKACPGAKANLLDAAVDAIVPKLPEPPNGKLAALFQDEKWHEEEAKWIKKQRKRQKRKVTIEMEAQVVSDKCGLHYWLIAGKRGKVTTSRTEGPGGTGSRFYGLVDDVLVAMGLNGSRSTTFNVTKRRPRANFASLNPASEAAKTSSTHTGR